MGILSWIVVGFIAGWLATQFIRGANFGLLGDIILGVAGGLVGGFLASTFLRIHDPVNGINLTSIMVAFAGSLALLFLMRFARRMRI
jgi:uncharacterized membrane protein YeaQ/YmgE (transglycosylase-associated protein family)